MRQAAITRLWISMNRQRRGRKMVLCLVVLLLAAGCGDEAVDPSYSYFTVCGRGFGTKEVRAKVSNAGTITIALSHWNEEEYDSGYSLELKFHPEHQDPVHWTEIRPGQILYVDWMCGGFVGCGSRDRSEITATGKYRIDHWEGESVKGEIIAEGYLGDNCPGCGFSMRALFGKP